MRLDSPGTDTSIELTGLLAGKSYTLYVNAYNADRAHGAVAVSSTKFVPAPGCRSLAGRSRIPTAARLSRRNWCTSSSPTVIQIRRHTVS